MKKMLLFLTTFCIIISCNFSFAESSDTKSPYEKWLSEKNTPDAGEVYNSYIGVLKDIKDGLKTGKIGTNKYRAAVDVLVPKEEVENVKKYVKTLERYITSGTVGVNHFIDDLLKYGFMEKLSNGSYTTTETANIEDIADKLNLKYEVVEASFNSLKDYGWNVALEKKKTTEQVNFEELVKLFFKELND